MKVLVYFEPTSIKHFEGARMRKSIKGALELSNVSHTRGILDNYDIAHLIAPIDDFRLHTIYEKKVPLVVSCLFCEDDENARYLEVKYTKDKNSQWFINNKKLIFLNKANVVIVPSVESKNLLIQAGVNSKIIPQIPGVNLTRFNFSREDEKEVFYRYFGFDRSKKTVIAIGDCTKNLDGIEAFNKCARNNPNINFVYVSPFDSNKFKHYLRKVREKDLKNVKIVNTLSDDLYRSALMNADLVLYPGISPIGVISLCDAMASKSQIIARKEVVIPGFLENEKDCYIATSEEELIDLVNKYLHEELQPTFEYAYNKISSRKLENFGEELIQIYNDEISSNNSIKQKIGGDLL